MLYGATDYPHEKTLDFWQQYLWTVATVLIIAVMVGIILFLSRFKQRRKEK
jgi:heme/copper-type cytochrome/quinol oxidase subunit 2